MTEGQYRKALRLPGELDAARRKLAALRVKKSRIPTQIEAAKAKVRQLEAMEQRLGGRSA
jgi:hypothetical protein